MPKPYMPFWQPWGCFGCLWRVLLYALLLLLLLFILSLFRECCCTGRSTINDPSTEFPAPSDKYIAPVSDEDGGDDRRADVDPEWNRPIPGGEDIGLPSPEDNVIPPIDDDKFIPNPDDGGMTQIYPDLLYVVFDSESESDDETFKTFATKFSELYPQPKYKIEYYNTGSKTAMLRVPENQRDSICKSLPEQIQEVKFFVIPVEKMLTGRSVTPNDPAFKYPEKSWHFAPIQAFEAWSITQGSDDIVVGIVDSYMDLEHPELRGDRILHPYSIPNKNSDVAPRSGEDMGVAGHGTLVTAVAVGTANNRVGSSGIAPKCKYIPVSMGGRFTSVHMVEGLLYCMYHGADVINLSCGSNFTEAATRLPIEAQIEYSRTQSLAGEKMWNYVFELAERRNVTIVWAAGNQAIFNAMDDSNRNDNTIRVSAVDQKLRKADFSNFGNFSDLDIYESTISAPGVYIFGALPGNTYDGWDGTSFSAPIIAGTVALMKSIDPELTTKEIIQILQETGKPVRGASDIGKLVQIKDALLRVKEMHD